MQQALDYAATLDIPFVFSSNGDGFVFHDRTGTRRARSRRTSALDDFPSPADLWARYRAWKGLDADAEAARPSGLLRRRQRQGAALLPGQRHQPHDRGHRQGPGPHPAGDGDRHRQDLHRVPDHLAAVEGGPQEAHPVPRRPQRAHRPDDGERLPPVRRGDGEAQHRRQDHRAARTAPRSNCRLALDRKRRIDTAYEIYLGLYQAITGPEERQKLFREFSPGFFDLIVIDECHRGSAAEDSAWREILDYFSAATQIGLTATPKETEYVSNIDYFGEPVYTYSLKQGISDGFLAPYKVVKVHIDRRRRRLPPGEGPARPRRQRGRGPHLQPEGLRPHARHRRPHQAGRQEGHRVPQGERRPLPEDHRLLRRHGPRRADAAGARQRERRPRAPRTTATSCGSPATTTRARPSSATSSTRSPSTPSSSPPRGCSRPASTPRPAG